MNTNPFFEYVNNFYTKVVPFSIENAQKNHYSILRIISFQRDSFFTADKLNRLPRLPEWAKAACLFYALPQRSPTPKRLPKKTKNYTTKKKEKQLNRIMRKFVCSEKHAEQILVILKNKKIRLGE